MNPPTEQTKMVSDQPKKMVKMVAITPIRLNKEDTPSVAPGQTFECDEQAAAQFEKPLKGYHKFAGSRPADEAESLRDVTIRAKRVK